MFGPVAPGDLAVSTEMDEWSLLHISQLINAKSWKIKEKKSALSPVFSNYCVNSSRTTQQSINSKK